MSPFRFLIDAGAVFLAGGIFLALYNTLLSGVEIIVKTWRRTFVSWAGRRLRAMGVIQEKPYQAHNELDWKRLVLLIATPGLAIAVHDFMLSPLVLDDVGTGLTNEFIRYGWEPPTYPMYGFLCWQIISTNDEPDKSLLIGQE